MNIIEELIKILKTKNIWRKNELLLILTELLAKHYKG